MPCPVWGPAHCCVQFSVHCRIQFSTREMMPCCSVCVLLFSPAPFTPVLQRGTACTSMAGLHCLCNLAPPPRFSRPCSCPGNSMRTKCKKESQLERLAPTVSLTPQGSFCTLCKRLSRGLDVPTEDRDLPCFVGITFKMAKIRHTRPHEVSLFASEQNPAGDRHVHAMQKFHHPPCLCY